jgi:four helix bundle protein
VRDHKKLRAFELADELALMIYKATKVFPNEEIYGIRAQMRRAAVSVPSNIVEGCAREGENECLRFLSIALGPLRELHYQFDLSRRLGYFDNFDVSAYEPKFIETEKVLGALIRSIKNS